MSELVWHLEFTKNSWWRFVKQVAITHNFSEGSKVCLNTHLTVFFFTVKQKLDIKSILNTTRWEFIKACIQLFVEGNIGLN